MPEYGDGAIYNDGSLYGFPSSAVPPMEGGTDNETAMAAAAAIAPLAHSHVRQTGLQVVVQGWGLNNWELLTGEEIDSDPTKTDSNSTLQTYWSYRNAADIIQLDDGTIVRVRLGDGTYGNRGVYRQIITDPTDVTQWETWTVYSASNNFGVALTTDGTTYHIYHTRIDGLYKDGAMIFAKLGLINPSPVVGSLNAVFVMQVSKDPIDITNPKTGSLWDRRRMDLWYSPDSSTFTEDPVNFRWYRNGICARLMDDSSVVRIQTNGMYTDPRAYNTGDSITHATMPSVSDNTPGRPLLIRGLGAQVGHNTVAGGRVFKLSDGFYYLIYDEYHSDVDFDSIVTPGISVCWQRSRDLIHWSEPVFTGFEAMIGGLVEDDDWVYFAGNDAVWRRPKTYTPYELSNYVPHCAFNLPRDNQDPDGSVLVANPGGVHDYLLPMAGSIIQVRPGIKIADGTYAYKDFGKWYIQKVERNTEGTSNRLTINLGDIWARLDNPLRDTFNWIGKTVWDDWGEGLRNKSFNYFFDITSTRNFTPTLTADTNTMNAMGLVLYTGWKGHNVIFSATISSGVGDTGIVYYRYVDPKNHYRLEAAGGAVILYRRRNNVDEVLVPSTGFVGALRFDIRWGRHRIYAAGFLIIDYTETDPGAKPGYVGWKVIKAATPTVAIEWTLSGFHLEDYERALTTADLIRTALAMGDYHETIIADTATPQFAVIWGPQTDIPTPAVALKTMLDAEKLQLVWYNGAYHVAKWTANTIKRTLQDEIISSTHTDEVNRRINLALVDGNTDTWIEVDALDTQKRGWQINAYYDAPELLTPEAVKARAKEEIRRGSEGNSPGGNTPLQFDLDRMDCITWIDNAGHSNNCRIQGIQVEINQSTEPSQRATWDLSLLEFEQPA